MPRKITITVSDAKVTNSLDDILITYSLGSCIGVSLHDATANVGGMLHYQLPTSTIDPQRAAEFPFMFVDTGMKILLDKVLSMGANKKRIRVKIAGGAAMDNGPAGFDIGKRNYLSLRKLLWQNGMFIDAEDVGGSSPRTMSLSMTDGVVTVKSDGVSKNL
jgi:chemotaxis protein CheD